MSAPSPVMLPEGSEPSQFSRIVNAIVAPGKAFAGLNRSPRWWMAWLLISLFSFAFIVAVDKRIGLEQVAQTVLTADDASAESIEKMPEEQRQQMISNTATVMKVTGYGAPVTTLIYMAVVAGVLLGTFNFGFATSMKFSTMLAIVAYSWMPYCISTVLAIVTMQAVDPADFRIDAPLASNLGALVDRTTSPVLATFLGGIDVFAIWVIVLMGIGVAMNSKLKRSTAIAGVAGWYVVIWLGKVAMAAIRS